MITTREWGANESRNATPGTHPIGEDPGITLHWTGNGYGWPWDHARCFDLVRGIERSHEYGNGWGDIAYNLLVCPHGAIFEGRGLHVRSAANGDSARNLARYAVCYLGGTGDRFTGAGRRGIRAAVQLLHRDGGARLDVNGHRDGWSTTCPGPVIYRWLNHTDWNQLEDDMPNPADIWGADLVPNLERALDRTEGNPKLQPRWALAFARRDARLALVTARQTDAKVDAIVDALEQLAPGVRAAAAKGARRALADGIEVTVSTSDREG